MSSNVILGIDPGLVKTGWGAILKVGYEIKYLDCGVIKTDPKNSMEIRLSHIFDSVQELIQKFNPFEIAMEEVFVNINPKTSEKLIMARSAAFISAAKSGFLVNEFKPNEIKKNITGSGHAKKEQVHIMVQKILKADIKNDNKTKTLDSMDALAVSLCQAFVKKF